MGASAYHLFKRTAEREFFVRSLRLGVITAFVGSFFTVGFGYAQFAPVQETQPGKFGEPIPGTALGLMIIIGQLVQLLVMFGLLPLLFRDLLARWRWLHPVLMALTPLPFLAAIAGWLVREVGRQPWLVYGKLSVADAMTPGLSRGAITGSLIGFVGVLGLLAIVDYVLIARAVRRGPAQTTLGAAEDRPTDAVPAPAPAL
jgi:cytochrome d ubiquinol oxidase subunit I